MNELGGAIFFYQEKLRDIEVVMKTVIFPVGREQK